MKAKLSEIALDFRKGIAFLYLHRNRTLCALLFGITGGGLFAFLPAGEAAGDLALGGGQATIAAVGFVFFLVFGYCLAFAPVYRDTGLGDRIRERNRRIREMVPYHEDTKFLLEVLKHPVVGPIVLLLPGPNTVVFVVWLALESYWYLFESVKAERIIRAEEKAALTDVEA